MKIKDSRPQIIKEAKKVEVKLLVPWGIILVMVVALTGTWFGWIARSEMNSKVDSEVAKQFERASKVHQ